MGHIFALKLFVAVHKTLNFFRVSERLSLCHLHHFANHGSNHVLRHNISMRYRVVLTVPFCPFPQEIPFEAVWNTGGMAVFTLEPYEQQYPDSWVNVSCRVCVSQTAATGSLRNVKHTFKVNQDPNSLSSVGHQSRQPRTVTSTTGSGSSVTSCDPTPFRWVVSSRWTRLK